MIISREKKEEYREITDYYISRLDRYVGEVIPICIRNGYSKTSHSAVIYVKVTINEGKVEWGAKDGESYYVLEIYDVYSNCKPKDDSWKYSIVNTSKIVLNQ